MAVSSTPPVPKHIRATTREIGKPRPGFWVRDCGHQGRFHPLARGLFTPATDLGEGVHAGLAERVPVSVHVDCVDADDNRAEHVVRLDAQEDVHALCYLSVMVA